MKKSPNKLFLIVSFCSLVSLISILLGWWAGFSALFETGAYELPYATVEELRKLLFERLWLTLGATVPVIAVTAYYLFVRYIQQGYEKTKS